MCEVNATLPNVSAATDHFKKAAEALVALTIVAADKGYDLVDGDPGSRSVWFEAFLTGAGYAATQMANTPEMQDAMRAAFDQALKAYE